MTSVAGRTNGVRPALTCLSPSSADSTEIAGVMMASPENSAAPATPSRNTTVVRLPIARLGERVERQNAALALVVGPHQEQHVFGGDDDQQRPDDQRHRADHLALGDAGVA